MWNKIKNSNAAYMVIAVVCAVLLWLYVDVTVEPDTRVVLRNIPVSFVGQEQMVENNLMITKGLDSTVTLTLKGPRSVVSQLKKSNVSVTVDLASQVSKAGEQVLGYTVTYPSSINTNSVKIDSRSVDDIDVTIVKMSTRSVAVKAVFRGTVAQGYMYDKKSFTLDAKEVTVIGEDAVVERIDHAEAVLDKEDLTDTWRGKLPITLVDKKGEEVSSDGLTLNIQRVKAVFPVTSVKEITLDVTIVEGGGATKSDVSYSISPKTIKVSGTKEDLEELDTFHVGTIDLSQVVTSEKESFAIDLPDGITNVSGTTTAKVKLKIDNGLTTTKLETSNIQVVNLPEHTGATLITENLELRIRGDKEVMKLLVKDDVYAVVDLSDVQEGTVGTVSFPAEIRVRGMSDIGAIGEYEVTLELYTVEDAEDEDASAGG